MKELLLTQGKFALVDDDDFTYLNQFKWYACHNKRKNTDRWYARRHHVCAPKSYIKVLMHREILHVPTNLFVDHINGNGLDNRKSNLRICTVRENNLNSCSVRGKSQYKGVTWESRCSKWQAKIQGTKEKTYLGLFKTEEEAAIAYNKAALKLFGAFAYLNEVPLTRPSVELKIKRSGREKILIG